MVLITDPLCYSATDIFSAGLSGQPNRADSLGGRPNWRRRRQCLGPRAAAAGAPRFQEPVLSRLPKGASFRVSVRRVIRAGTHQGDATFEDLGVQPDQLHRMTKNDVLSSNVDLIAKAAQLLAATP